MIAIVTSSMWMILGEPAASSGLHRLPEDSIRV
jgi:hypothetical protein